jgi:folate-binding protein YgfZ
VTTAADGRRAGVATLGRAVLEASGPQRQRLLQGLLTNEVVGLAPGEGRLAALLNAKGGIQALVRVLVDETVVVLETGEDQVERLQETLEHYRVAAPVRFARPACAVLALLGRGTDDVAREAGLTPPPLTSESHRRGTLAGHAVRLVRAGDLPGGGLVVHVAAEAKGAAREALLAAGATPLSPSELDARRVEALRPWYGTDVREEHLLHETGLVAECHSATKGCYLGQEVIARLEARGGKVSRALRGLRLSAPAAAGDAITCEGREVGRVTTAALSPGRGPIAMGYVHRSAFAPGTRVEVAGAPATVVSDFVEREGP